MHCSCTISSFYEWILEVSEMGKTSIEPSNPILQCISFRAMTTCVRVEVTINSAHYVASKFLTLDCSRQPTQNTAMCDNFDGEDFAMVNFTPTRIQVSLVRGTFNIFLELCIIKLTGYKINEVVAEQMHTIFND